LIPLKSSCKSIEGRLDFIPSTTLPQQLPSPFKQLEIK